MGIEGNSLGTNDVLSGHLCPCVSEDSETIMINSFTPGRCGTNFKIIICKLIMQKSSLGIHCEVAAKWMP